MMEIMKLMKMMLLLLSLPDDDDHDNGEYVVSFAFVLHAEGSWNWCMVVFWLL